MKIKKRIANLEYFREMLHICPRLPNQTFDELPFEEEILAFLRYLGHSGEIRKLTDGMYHKKNVDFAYLLWEDFVYQVEHKDAKKRNEMYYPHFFMTKDPSIPRRNKVNWHYVRDGQMFTKIKLVLRHQNTQQFSAMLPIELTNEDIRNSAAYKEYYAIASGETPPKTKASVRKTQSSFDITMQPLKATSTRLSTSAKGKQPAKSFKANGLSVLFEVAMTEAEQMKLATKRSLQQTHISQASASGADEGTGIIPGVLDVPTDESDEEISWKSSDEDDDDEVDDRSNDDANLGMNVGDEEGQDAKDDDEELYRDVNINLEDNSPGGCSSLNYSGLSYIDCTNSSSSNHSYQFLSTTSTNSSNNCSKHFSAGSSEFCSLFRFDRRLKTLEANFSEFVQTNQFFRAVSFLLEIVERYMDQRMNKAVKIIKEKVKEQVKVQVSKILPKIEKTMNEQLKAEFLTRSSNSSKTSYAVAADLSEMELKKILIEKIESNKDTVTLKRRRDDADKDEEPSAGSDRGSKRRREGKEPESISAPKEKATKTTGKSTKGSKSHQKTTSESAPAEEPRETTQDLEEPSHQQFKTDAAADQPIAKASQHPECGLAKQDDSRSSFNELMDTPVDFSAFLMNRLKVDTLTPELLAGRRVIPFDHFINNNLEYLRGGAFSRKYTTSVTKTKAADYGHIKWIEDLVPRTMWSQEPVSYDKHALWGISYWGYKLQQFYGFAVNRESARDVYLKRRIIAVTELLIFEWHNYKHLDWIMVRRDDDKLYKFKEGYFKRLCIQDIKDMLLLLVQEKLTNLTVKECFAFNVSLRMFTRSIIIQRCMEDLQLGIESYQKKLNLTKPDTDEMLNDVQTALDDHLKGMQMKYLSQAIWRRSDNERAAVVIQAIDKQLKTRRIMRSLEKFVGGRLYGRDGYPLVSVEVLRYDKRSKSENTGIVPAEMELILEHTQQGISHEVLNPNENGNVVAARTEGNAIGNICIQIRCYNCRGLGHLARNCTLRPGRRRILMRLRKSIKTAFRWLICSKHRHRVLRLTKLPSMTQTDQLRLQNLEIQLLKEAAKFVRDFKSLAKEAEESLAKHKDLELEIERLLRAVVSHDILSIVQSNYVMDTSNT
nr:hypothetical protein [Tanacetum cinerariifolium]